MNIGDIFSRDQIKNIGNSFLAKTRFKIHQCDYFLQRDEVLDFIKGLNFYMIRKLQNNFLKDLKVW